MYRFLSNFADYGEELVERMCEEYPPVAVFERSDGRNGFPCMFMRSVPFAIRWQRHALK